MFWRNIIWTYWNVFDAFQSIAIISFVTAEIILSSGWFLGPFDSPDGLESILKLVPGDCLSSESHALKTVTAQAFLAVSSTYPMTRFLPSEIGETWRAGRLQPSKPRCRASCPLSGDLSALEWGGHHKWTDMSWSNVPELCTCHATEPFYGPPDKGNHRPHILPMSKWISWRVVQCLLLPSVQGRKVKDRSS